MARSVSLSQCARCKLRHGADTVLIGPVPRRSYHPCVQYPSGVLGLAVPGRRQTRCVFYRSNTWRRCGMRSAGRKLRQSSGEMVGEARGTTTILGSEPSLLIRIEAMVLLSQWLSVGLPSNQPSTHLARNSRSSQRTSCGFEAVMPLNARCSGFNRTLCSRPRVTMLGTSRTAVLAFSSQRSPYARLTI